MKKLNLEQKNMRVDFAIERICDYLLGENVDVFSASWAIRDLNTIRAVVTPTSVKNASLHAVGRIQTMLKKCDFQSEELKRAQAAIVEVYTFYYQD